MSTYTPDAWVILEINSARHGVIHKVLAGWYGGFTGANSWKISSGIEGLSEDKNGAYVMPQFSGSTYVCHQGVERMSSLMADIYSNFAALAAKPENGFSVKVISIDELKAALTKTE
jgi:hypothetical protein